MLILFVMWSVHCSLDFWGLSEVILLRALDVLVNRKKVALIRADIPSETGIKFLDT